MFEEDCNVLVSHKPFYRATAILLFMIAIFSGQCNLYRTPAFAQIPDFDSSLNVSRSAWLSNINRRANDLLKYRVGLEGKTKQSGDESEITTFRSEFAALGPPLIEALVGPLIRTPMGEKYPAERTTAYSVRVRSSIVRSSIKSELNVDAVGGRAVSLTSKFNLVIVDMLGRPHNFIVNSRGEVQQLRFEVTELWVQAPTNVPTTGSWTLKDLQVLPGGLPVRKTMPEREDWMSDRANLSQNPVGFTIHEDHFTNANLISVAPTGINIAQAGEYLSPTYGLGRGVEVAAGLWDINRNNGSTVTLYPGVGIQKQLLPDAWPNPIRTAVSIGAYGYSGPDTEGGTIYLAASHRVFSGSPEVPLSLYLHSGIRWDTFSSNTDQSGVRPYIGFSVAILSKYYVGGEIRYRQAWERETPFGLHATVKVYRRFGITVGVANYGYQTVIYVSPSF